MQNVFVSTLPTQLFLAIASDPNVERQRFIRVKGLREVVDRLTLTIRSNQMVEVFKREYKKWNLRTSSLLELYPHLPNGDYVLEIECDEFKQQVLLEF